MRLLIVTARYYPQFDPRAHRWTSLAEHWSSSGHEVHVVCARNDQPAATETWQGVHIHRTGYDSLKEVFYDRVSKRYARGRVGAPASRPSRLMRGLMWLYQNGWKQLYFPDDACVWRRAAGRRLQVIMSELPFDALITVSLPFTCHCLGLTLHRQFPELPWLADIGDPFTIQPRPPNNRWLYGRRSRRLELEVLRQAQAVTVTNRAMLKEYADTLGTESVGRMHVIPPVWHPWQEPNWQPPRSSPGEEIHLGYFGAFYAPTRTPDLLLQFLDGVNQLAPQLSRRMHVHIYGDVFPEFLPRLQQSCQVQLHGYRPRDESQRDMQRMDWLINIGNTTSYQLPSKAVNYLAAARPVVNLVQSSPDLFGEFWGDWPGLVNVRVSGGTPSRFDLQLFVQQADSPPGPPDPDCWRARMQQYSAATIGSQYEQLLDHPGPDPQPDR